MARQRELHTARTAALWGASYRHPYSRRPNYSRGRALAAGLRDFFNFVKLLDRRMRRQKTRALDDTLLIECILRSFGGFRLGCYVRE